MDAGADLSQTLPGAGGSGTSATILVGDTVKSSSSKAPMPVVDYQQWIGDAVKLLESFDPKKTTVDAHYDDVFGAGGGEKAARMASARKKFAQQVFYCCIRYQKFLNLFVNAFLYKNPASAPRSDQSIYMILGCLLFFRVDELGTNEMGKILLKSNISTPPALNALLEFVFSEEDLNNWVKMEWCKVYDMTFLEQEVIGKMQRKKPEMQRYIDELRTIAVGASAVEKSAEGEGATLAMAGRLPGAGKVTKIQAFNITKPKPRLIPQPDVIGRVYEAKPPPKTIYATSLEQVQKEGAERREKVAAATRGKYDAERDEFVLETAKRPAADDDAKDRYAKDVEDVRYRECTFQPKINQLPGGKLHLEQIADVRQNASSILREDNLVRKKQEKEYNVLMDYERGLRDASEYFMWQYNERVKDDVEEKCRVEQRKIEMQMAAAAAREAMELQFQKNVLNAEQIKLEKQVAEKKKAKTLAAEEANKRALCREVYDMRGRPRVQLDIVDENRRKNAEEIKRDKAKRFEIKKADDEHEMEQRKDLIRQIRAIVRVSTVTAEPYDPSEPPRHGILDEMSLAELHERYKVEKAIAERKRLEKRDFILDEKNEKRKILLKKAENLSRIREIARDQARERHEKKKEETKAQAAYEQKLKDVACVEAADRIKKKKEARFREEQRLAKELKEINVKRQFLAAGAEQMEAKQNYEQLQGLERELKDRQSEMLHSAKVGRKVRKQELKNIKMNKVNEKDEIVAMIAGVNERLQASKKDDALLREEYRLERRDAHAEQRRVEARLHQTQLKQLPYATRLTQESIRKARTWRESHPEPVPLPP
ncbi:unnamed protein product [Amoebophrya sp. A25]|nr:unnamed protein product [Amoebophrya sp. A25]|eukprot:GSA25T00009687001.1